MKVLLIIRTLYKAFKEVEDALDAEARLAREEASLEQAALEYSDAETLAWDRYGKALPMPSYRTRSSY